MNKLNQISMSQKLSYNVSTGKSENKKWAMALQVEVASLGFKLDRKLLNVIATQSNKEIKKIKEELIKDLSERVGDNVSYEPLFLNFPDQVPQLNQYYFRRMLSYIDDIYYRSESDENVEKLSCGCYVDKDLFDLDMFGTCPVCQYQAELENVKKERKVLKEKPVLKKISFIDREGQIQIIKNLLDSKIAYSSGMQDNVKLAVQELKEEIIELLPVKFDNKENLAFIGAVLLKTEETKKLFRANEYYKTATDILRLATALVAGDVSLTKNADYKLTSSERKLVMSLLDSVKGPLEDMLRYRQKWLLLSRYLHVGSYAKKYPRAAKHVDVLRNSHKTIDTFSKTLHKELAILKDTKNNEKVVKLLLSRPGELARRLDYVIRHSDDSVIESFASVVENISTALLLKLNSTLGSRSEKSEFRSYMPKGNLAKIHYVEGDDRDVLKKETIKKIDKVIQKELKSRFSKNEKLKNVYVDEKLKKILAPLVLRNTSKTLRTIPRGSKIDLSKKAKFIRLFLYWKDKDRVTDLDLSAVMYNEKFEMVTLASWQRLRGDGFSHSGDIRSAPQGACEFIDLDMDRLSALKVKYIVANVISFAGSNFEEIGSHMGFMEREGLSSGQVFEPKTVQEKFDLSGDTKDITPFIFDLENREVTWIDVTNGNQSFSAVTGTNHALAKIAKSIMAMETNTPNMFDIVSLQAKARGATVDTVKQTGVKYDEVFDLDRVKDLSDIAANWLK